MVTIKFIAQKAGVSTATVSRVLNHTKYVSPEVEKKGTAGSRKIQLFSECCCNRFIYESHQDFRTLGCR